MKQVLLSLAFLLTLCSVAAAQDKIYTTTQKAPIEGEVTEVTVNEIKYRPTGRPTPVISVDKQDVVKIVYQNGEVYMINNPLKDFAVYGNQKKWNAKLNLLSPLQGHTQLYLEQALKPGRSAEYELNLIGLGKDPYASSLYYYRQNRLGARGLGLGYGMKFLRLPDYVNGQVRLRHILQGSYVKPGFSLAYYSRNFLQFNNNNTAQLVRQPVFSANLYTSFGKQWILDNAISIEVYAQVGYGIDNVRSTQKKVGNDAFNPNYFGEDNMPFNAFGYTRFTEGDFGLSLGGGFRLGYLFNVKKKDKQQ